MSKVDFIILADKLIDNAWNHDISVMFPKSVYPKTYNSTL